MHIFAALAEFEAALIRERTTAGLRAARRRCRVSGRPRTGCFSRRKLLSPVIHPFERPSTVHVSTGTELIRQRNDLDRQIEGLDKEFAAVDAYEPVKTAKGAVLATDNTFTTQAPSLRWTYRK